MHMTVVMALQDFNSPKLKHKKHWLSFTSAFFLHLRPVLQQLRDNGRLAINQADKKALLTGDLCCHRCDQPCRTMPALNAHIANCTHPIPDLTFKVRNSEQQMSVS